MAYTRLSDANMINEQFLDSILIEERLIDSVEADLKCRFLGEEFSMPVMTPAFSHLGNYAGRELTGLEEYSVAAKDLNILNFCGMMENDMFKKIADTGAKTVRIVKPYADNGKVRDQMAFAKECGAFAIGMDIDHIFGPEGYDVVLVLLGTTRPWETRSQPGLEDPGQGAPPSPASAPHGSYLPRQPQETGVGAPRQ